MPLKILSTVWWCYTSTILSEYVSPLQIPLHFICLSQSHPPTHLQFVHYVQVFCYQCDISTYRHLSLGNRRDLMYHNYLINRDYMFTRSTDVSSIPGAC